VCCSSSSQCFGDLPYLHSFPTRRSSDLFRGWLVRISFRLALDKLRSGKRREQRDTLWSQPAHLPPPLTAEDVAASNQFQNHLERDRKSTRLNSSHLVISYAVFCLKKKKD